jgi:hypothetical protein
MARTFTVATTVQDPLLAERLVETLQGKGLDAFARAGGAASSAAFAQAQPAFWDVLVPSEGIEAAERLIAETLETLDEEAEANGRAAEEEAMAGADAGKVER